VCQVIRGKYKRSKSLGQPDSIREKGNGAYVVREGGAIREKERGLEKGLSEALT